MPDLSAAFQIASGYVTCVALFCGLTQLLHSFLAFTQGLALLATGGLLGLAEFRPSPALRQRAAFLYTFEGRGAAHLLVGVLAARLSWWRVLLGLGAMATGAGYIWCGHIGSVEAPWSQSEVALADDYLDV